MAGTPVRQKRLPHRVAAADRKQVLIFADAINAVWMWKKLVLRGSTRDAKGGEQLAYFKGGFGRLAQAMADEITRLGGRVQYGAPVSGLGLSADGQQVEAVQTAQGSYTAREFLFTPALPIIADIFEGSAKADWLASLRRVNIWPMPVWCCSWTAACPIPTGSTSTTRLPVRRRDRTHQLR
jgi:protoporphyrinogen oxidase